MHIYTIAQIPIPLPTHAHWAAIRAAGSSARLKYNKPRYSSTQHNDSRRVVGFLNLLLSTIPIPPIYHLDSQSPRVPMPCSSPCDWLTILSILVGIWLGFMTSAPLYGKHLAERLAAKWLYYWCRRANETKVKACAFGSNDLGHWSEFHCKGTSAGDGFNWVHFLYTLYLIGNYPLICPD